MQRESHELYNRALLALKNGQRENFEEIFLSLELTVTERNLLNARLCMANEKLSQARSLLLNLHSSSSRFLNGERALLLGHCYGLMHDPIKCRFSYAAAIKEFIFCNDRKGLFLAYAMLGRSLTRGGLYPLALQNLQSAEKLALCPREKSTIQRHLSYIYSKTHDFTKALIYITKVLENSIELSEKEVTLFKSLKMKIQTKIERSQEPPQMLNLSLEEFTENKPDSVH